MTYSAFVRSDGRPADAMRPVKIKNNIAPASTGSVLISMGNTQVICAASVEESVPRWMRMQNVFGGWITAEYSLLPYATGDRSRRESSSGRVGGRTHEIQRLIGRSLRAVVDLEALGSRTVWVDCDVLCADAGTRTASVTGGYVALALAINKLIAEGKLESNPIKEPVAAVSVGVVQGEPLLDLAYDEDVDADVDMNVVMTGSGKFVEIQGTAEAEPFSKSMMDKLTLLAKNGILQLIEDQNAVLGVK